eukprot:TRINITY_DN16960_c0_g1_i1.p1 TRINITY_DN16960_c0_g1~~TRINITY_DN16960_c0_g1_i1.p1  ORF type:complete len:663 (+),score=126.65 TRINITY_DN16960_c0_g1_i1:285-2273(+)
MDLTPGRMVQPPNKERLCSFTRVVLFATLVVVVVTLGVVMILLRGREEGSLVHSMMSTSSTAPSTSSSPSSRKHHPHGTAMAEAASPLATEIDMIGLKMNHASLAESLSQSEAHRDEHRLVDSRLPWLDNTTLMIMREHQHATEVVDGFIERYKMKMEESSIFRVHDPRGKRTKRKRPAVETSQLQQVRNRPGIVGRGKVRKEEKEEKEQCALTYFQLLHIPKTGGRTIEMTMQTMCKYAADFNDYELDAMQTSPFFESDSLQSSGDGHGGGDRERRWRGRPCTSNKGHSSFANLRSRTGGTNAGTMKEMLQPHAPLRNDEHPVGHVDEARQRRRLRRLRAKLHRDFESSDCRYLMSVSRDPVSRVRSSFHTTLGRTDGTGFGSIGTSARQWHKHGDEERPPSLFERRMESGEMTFREFVMWRGDGDGKGADEGNEYSTTISTHNTLMKFLITDKVDHWSGAGYDLDEVAWYVDVQAHPDYDTLLELAMKRILQFDYLGVTETMEKSLQLLSATFHLNQRVVYSVSNKNNYDHAPLPKEVELRILQLNRADLVLHKLVTELYTRRYASMVKHFEEKERGVADDDDGDGDGDGDGNDDIDERVPFRCGTRQCTTFEHVLQEVDAGAAFRDDMEIEKEYLLELLEERPWKAQCSMRCDRARGAS